MRPVPETEGHGPAGESEDGAGLDGALAMRREALSDALRETGFLDINGASVARMEAYVAQGTAVEEEVETGLNSRTAWELASYIGGEVTGDVNLVLRILARIDPEWVALLLK
jgi:hypothetical protein